MRAVLISDLHLRTKEPLDGPTPWRLEEKLRVLRDAVETYMAEGDALFVLGDVFDTREPPEWLKLKFWECLVPIFMENDPDRRHQVFILLGNHDSNLQHHAFESDDFLVSCLTDNVKIIDAPTSELISGTTFTMVPYCKQDDMKAAINKALESDFIQDSGNSHVLLGHCEVDGAVMGPAQIRIKAQVHPSDLVGFSAAVFGHIHQAQGGRYEGGTWHYLGSPVYQDFGEMEDPTKGFGILVADPDMELRIQPTNPIEMVQLTIEDTEEPTDAELEAIHDKAVKVIFRGEESFLKSKDVSTMREFWLDQERKGEIRKVMFDTFCTDRQVDNADEQAASLEEEMRKLCAERDAEKLLDIGMNLLQEAKDEAAAG